MGRKRAEEMNGMGIIGEGGRRGSTGLIKTVRPRDSPLSLSSALPDSILLREIAMQLVGEGCGTVLPLCRRDTAGSEVQCRQVAWWFKGSKDEYLR